MVTIRHERSPAELRGRVFSSFSAIAMVAQPLGMVAVGAAIEQLGFHAFSSPRSGIWTRRIKASASN